MFCPKCGSENVKRVRTGDWRCSECATYFKIDASGPQALQPEMNKYQNLVSSNKKKKSGAQYPLRIFFIAIMLAIVLIIVTGAYKDGRGINHRKWAAIEKIDSFLESRPYYVHKSDYEAQKDSMHPALKGLQIGMKINRDELSKKDFLSQARFVEDGILLNSFCIMTMYDTDEKIMGIKHYDLNGTYENDKLLKMSIDFKKLKNGKDSVLAERIREWAGKGCYVTYNTKVRKNEYEWQYKNANITMKYDRDEITLTLEQPGVNLDSLQKEKYAALRASWK